jgi:hypothetical protein
MFFSRENIIIVIRKINHFYLICSKNTDNICFVYFKLN